MCSSEATLSREFVAQVVNLLYTRRYHHCDVVPSANAYCYYCLKAIFFTIVTSDVFKDFLNSLHNLRSQKVSPSMQVYLLRVRFEAELAVMEAQKQRIELEKQREIQRLEEEEASIISAKDEEAYNPKVVEAVNKELATLLKNYAFSSDDL